MDIAKRVTDIFLKPQIFNTRGRSGFYPSQASVETDHGVLGACLRESYYNWFDCESTSDVNPEYSLRAVIGEWFHEGFVELLRHHPLETQLTVLSAEQMFFDKQNMLSGRSDIFLLDNKTDELYGVDIKSVGEWAGKMVMHEPKPEHILQCAIYLYEYQKNRPKDSKNIDKWIILYISRDENWDLKKYAHGSTMQLIWQYTMSFENDYVVVVDPQGRKKSYKEITIKKITDRYKALKEAIKTQTLPDRDYELQYSEDKIVALYRENKIKFKKDIKVIEDWLQNGAVKGELKLTIGDDGCRFCNFVDTCYSADPTKFNKKSSFLHNIKDNSTPSVDKKSMF